MMYVLSPCLLSLLFISFFIGSTATFTTSLSHHDEYASRNKDFKMLSKNAKVTTMLASASTDKRNKLDSETLSWTTNKAKRLKKVTLEKGEISRKSSSKNNVVTKCDYVSKVSSKSVSSSVKEASSDEGCQTLGRKLIPSQQDMDAFVAYADYRGPQHHPPKNN